MMQFVVSHLCSLLVMLPLLGGVMRRLRPRHREDRYASVYAR